MDDEVIHSGFETITEYEQDYRISTEVRFFTSGLFKYRASLWKSYNGSVRGEPIHETGGRTKDSENLERNLQEAVDKCKEKMEEIEKAKLLEIDVNIR